MLGHVTFRRFVRQRHCGLRWLLCVGGHRSAVRSVWSARLVLVE